MSGAPGMWEHPQLPPSILCIVLSYCEVFQDADSLITIINDDEKIQEINCDHEFFLDYDWRNTCSMTTPMTTPMKFVNLRVLNMHCFVKNIDDISMLKELRELDLAGFGMDITRRNSISPLAGLVKLRVLRMPWYRGGDIAPLEGLTELQVLDLSWFAEGNIAPLKNLTKLEDLNLCSYGGDITPLAGLLQLRKLILNRFDGDIKALAGLIKLEVLDLSGYGGDNVDGGDNLRPLGNLTNLRELDLGITSQDKLSALVGLTKLQRLTAYSSDCGVPMLDYLANLRSSGKVA